MLGHRLGEEVGHMDLLDFMASGALAGVREARVDVFGGNAFCIELVINILVVVPALVAKA
jgi:hypothetical protein